MVTNDGVDVRVSRFRIWAIRPLGSARLSWREIYGVQIYEIPNFATRTGVQVDYVLHIARGTFAVSSIQFAQAERIAALIAGHVGREVGELPAGIAPVGASRLVAAAVFAEVESSGLLAPPTPFRQGHRRRRGP